MRQRIIATACVYYFRFYSRNSYAATDPILVLVTCVYVAGKVEEGPSRIRIICSEASKMLEELGYTGFSNHIGPVAEMEFYLLEELEFNLIVFHIYPTLDDLCLRCARSLQEETKQDTFNPSLEPIPEPVDESLLQMAW